MDCNRLVFIMGPPRSGTTALTRLLMSHPDVFLADAKALQTVNQDAPTYYESGIFFRDLSDDEVRARFAALPAGDRMIVEKTPSHIVHLERIIRMFPSAHFVITHREPYSCMLSWKVASRTFLKSGISFREACYNWRFATEALLAHAMRENVVIVDYHQFMTHTEAVGHALFDRLKLDQSRRAECLQLMNAPETERLKEVVGETIRGGNTRLTLKERWRVFRACMPAERAWRSAIGERRSQILTTASPSE